MNNRGFTLLEALVAVAIVAIAIAGPLLVASRALAAAELSRDQLTAASLSQSGIEFARALRDDQFLKARAGGGSSVSQTAWSNFITTISPCAPTAGNGSTCTFDEVSWQYASCVGTCQPLVLLNGQYRQKQYVTGGTPTPFTRTIWFTALSSTEELVTVTVSWSFHKISHSVVVTDHLTPWQ